MSNFPNILNYEKNLYDRGVRLIAGVDEVGRGPLAGPIVVGAVILDLDKVFSHIRNYDVGDGWNKENNLYSRIKDSKLLTEKRRVILSDFIRENAINFSIVEISHGEIDVNGISKANQLAFYNSIKELKVKPEHVFTDNFEMIKLVKSKQTNIKRGDNNSLSVASASIIAKVYRDNIMVELSKKYPIYGFDRHKGYGTKEHIDNIFRHGICDIHRKSFEPIKSLLKNAKITP